MPSINPYESPTSAAAESSAQTAKWYHVTVRDLLWLTLVVALCTDACRRLPMLEPAYNSVENYPADVIKAAQMHVQLAFWELVVAAGITSIWLGHRFWVLCQAME